MRNPVRPSFVTPAGTFNELDVQNKWEENTHTLTHPWEDQCECHRITRMAGPDCAVMCNLINMHTHTHAHACMYGHTYSKSMDQPGKVANPARGQLNRGNEYFPVCPCL